ncbi:hypothetical protein B0J11DRAFT_91580 [Dendryphion nanum]|uniref:Uncharacterized protein n=1 Tax=Dendryphion nanum TaxID=256645 RepID=A0A9P9DF32_9PLEO|nr:hypothetical protein B0J11DRAFT_91580 [Dendryphion nanum]
MLVFRHCASGTWLLLFLCYRYLLFCFLFCCIRRPKQRVGNEGDLARTAPGQKKPLTGVPLSLRAPLRGPEAQHLPELLNSPQTSSAECRRVGVVAVVAVVACLAIPVPASFSFWGPGLRFVFVRLSLCFFDIESIAQHQATGCIMRRQRRSRWLKASRESAVVHLPSCSWMILEDSPPKMHAVLPGLEPGILVALHHVQRVCPQNNVPPQPFFSLLNLISLLVGPHMLCNQFHSALRSVSSLAVTSNYVRFQQSVTPVNCASPPTTWFLSIIRPSTTALATLCTRENYRIRPPRRPPSRWSYSSYTYTTAGAIISSRSPHTRSVWNLAR